jgi:hypothetical protein
MEVTTILSVGRISSQRGSDTSKMERGLQSASTCELDIKAHGREAE